MIIPTPYWVSYPEQVKLAGGVPVYVEGYEKNRFKITLEQLESAITDKTKAVIINSPIPQQESFIQKRNLLLLGKFV